MTRQTRDDIEGAFEALRARGEDDERRERRVWESIEAGRRAPKPLFARPAALAGALALAAAVALSLWSRVEPEPPRAGPPLQAITRVDGQVHITGDHVLAKTESRLIVHGHAVVLGASGRLHVRSAHRWQLETGALEIEPAGSPSQRPLIVATDHLEAELRAGWVRMAAIRDQSSVQVLSGRADLTVAPGCVGPATVEAGTLATVTYAPVGPVAPPPAEPPAPEAAPVPKPSPKPRPRPPARVDPCPAWMQEADALRRAGVWREAVQIYGKVADSPDAGALREEALLRQAELLTQQGRKQQARAALLRARQTVSDPLLLPEREALERSLEISSNPDQKSEDAGTTQ